MSACVCVCVILFEVIFVLTCLNISFFLHFYLSKHLENQRRRHNYVPLCVSILKEIAKAGKLPELVENAKERKAQKRAKR